MQKTAYEMRSSDWSSDVCSSDLVSGVIQPTNRGSVPATARCVALPPASMLSQAPQAWNRRHASSCVAGRCLADRKAFWQAHMHVTLRVGDADASGTEFAKIGRAHV